MPSHIHCVSVLVSRVVQNQDVAFATKNNTRKAEMGFSDTMWISYFAVVCNRR